MSKTPKKKSSSVASSASGVSAKKDSSSSLASLSRSTEDLKKSPVSLRPEWSDGDVTAEKWDSKTAKDSRLFEDPDGKVELPASLSAHTWKRPAEFILNKSPVVVEGGAAVDLVSPNEHLFSSELMRWIISEIYILWKLSEDKPETSSSRAWSPWSHIYSLCGPQEDHLPLYNCAGKYLIRLYWMGCWRKLVVDDTFPFDKDERLLLPASPLQWELWPMLLTKGLLKLAWSEGSVEAPGREFSTIHSLTGWIPEIIHLKSWHTETMWGFLTGSIPGFQPPQENEEGEGSEKSAATEPSARDPSENETKPPPQVVVCASYQQLHLLENKTSALTKMADSSQVLRQYGLSQVYSHPVLLTRTRDQPLASPPLQSKLLWPGKQNSISDEPRELPVQNPHQFIEVSSPFINLNLMTSAAHDTGREAARRCGFRSSLTSFSEMDHEEEQEEPERTHTHTEEQVPAEDKNEDDSMASVTPVAERSCLLVSGGGDQDASERRRLRETWVDLHNFTKCFQNLLIFHRPHTYTHQCKAPHYTSSEGKITRFLLVDSVLPSDVVVCFSALVCDISAERAASPRPALLTARPFSWKSIVSELPLMQLRTTACRAASLSLPPGRHVLQVHAAASFGLHLHLCSMSPFVFAEEETVMLHLNKESLGFCQQAERIRAALARVIRCFSDPEELPSATADLERAHGVGVGQLRVFSGALRHMFSSALGRSLSRAELLAVQTLTLDPSCHTDTRKTYDTPDVWSDRQATDQETRAVTVLQAGVRGFLVREILSGARAGTKQNLSVTKTLQEMWAQAEADGEKSGLLLLGHMVETDEGVTHLCPSGEDERYRITFTDYSVPVSEGASSWSLIFREVFHVPKKMLLVPKIFSSFPGSIMHVIDNDTLQEIPRVFNRVEPHVYRPNQKGYTFVAETHSAPPGGSWKMRLIGSRGPLPQTSRENPSNDFTVKELKNYYLPNPQNIICRHTVKVSSDHTATVQFQTSQPDVLLKLSILDCEREVVSSQGKGHAIIPVYCFVASTGGAEAGDTEELPPVDPQQVHKYHVQAELLLDSWTLDESLAPFIQSLREAEMNEMRVFQEILEGTTVPEPPAKGSNKSSKASPKTKEQTFDVSKPHWTLRVVSEKKEAAQVEVKKDTEKLEQMKAMKLAWEAAAPGRASQAHQSRQEFLKEQQEQNTPSEETDASAEETLDDHAHFLEFIRMTLSCRPLEVEMLKQEQERERSEKSERFRLIWDHILDQCQREKHACKEMMKRQLQAYVSFQDTMDRYRQKMLEAREGFCSITREDTPPEDTPPETLPPPEPDKPLPSKGRKGEGKKK